jgi:hypothetical protein
MMALWAGGPSPPSPIRAVLFFDALLKSEHLFSFENGTKKAPGCRVLMEPQPSPIRAVLFFDALLKSEHLFSFENGTKKVPWCRGAGFS